jgi:hypothetical protein
MLCGALYGLAQALDEHVLLQERLLESPHDWLQFRSRLNVESNLAVLD